MDIQLADILDSKELYRRRIEAESILPENLTLRLHRSLSWLERAEQQTDDDTAFIFYWLAFNALYARERVNNFDLSESERGMFGHYFEKIAKLDKSNLIYDEFWQRFSDSVRNLLGNKFVFQPFWNHYNHVPGNEDWEERFEKTKSMSLRALQNEDTEKILQLIFDRLYVLRNQVFHGAATWRSSVNRDQIRDSLNILAFLVPILIDLMMKNPQESWGQPCYPVVK